MLSDNQQGRFLIVRKCDTSTRSIPMCSSLEDTIPFGEDPIDPAWLWSCAECGREISYGELDKHGWIELPPYGEVWLCPNCYEADDGIVKNNYGILG